MEHVRRCLQESEEKAIIWKKVVNSLDGKITLERTKVDISLIQLEQQSDQKTSFQLAQLDKTEGKELSDAAKTIEKEQLTQLKKALSDQHSIFERMIAHERGKANQALRKCRQDNEESKKNERQIIDSLINEVRAQVEELENDRFRLKGMIQYLLPLIEQKEDHRNMNVQVPDGMICMTRTYFDIAVDNYCSPDVIMKFKVFKLEKIYPDLQKYDLRAEWGMFGIEGTYVPFSKFMRALTYHGYIYDAEVYYLDPAHRSDPLTGLVKIVGHGQDEINDMVRAHTEQGTKICLLYLVSIHENQRPDDEMLVMEDEMDEEPATE